jgi:hypothetical protein
MMRRPWSGEVEENTIKEDVKKALERMIGRP